MRHPDERPTGGAWSGVDHPDEGTIHAWLDDALPPDDAAALERHVAGCAACGAAVAEARGLIAASSQILARLDRVPGGVLPAAGAAAGDMASDRSEDAPHPSAGDVQAVEAERDRGVVPLAPRRPASVPVWRRGSVRAVAALALVAVGVTAVLRETGSERSLSELTASPEWQEASAPVSDAAAASPLADSAAGSAGEAADRPAAASGAAAPERGGAAVRKAAPAEGSDAAVPPAAPSPAAPRRAEADTAAERLDRQRRLPDVVTTGVASEERRASGVAAASAPPPPPVPAGSTATLRTFGVTADSLMGKVQSFPAPGDSAVVAGRVVARGSGTPIAGAVVRLQGRREGAVTDSAGRFRLSGVPGGSFVAQVHRSGFHAESVTVQSVTAGAPGAASGQVTVALRPQSDQALQATADAARAQSARAGAGTGAARVERQSAEAAAPAAPQQPVPSVVERFAGCYRLSVGGAASEARDHIEGALPGWLRLDRASRPPVGWYAAGSAAGDDVEGREGARWRAADALVSVEWPADDRVLELRLRPWAEGLAGTAAWRVSEEPREEVSVLARRVACGG